MGHGACCLVDVVKFIVIHKNEFDKVVMDGNFSSSNECKGVTVIFVKDYLFI